MKHVNEQQQSKGRLWFSVGVCLLSLTLLGLKSPTGFEDPGPPTDGQLKGAVERRLDMDSRISSENVRVTVENNHATLIGTVNTIREKEVAPLIAGTIRGVEGVTNNLSIAPSLSKDDHIQASVEQVLGPIHLKEENRLTVNVEKGVVTLGGTVLSHQDSRRARQAAENVPGVVEVHNVIKVVSQNRMDEDIEEDVVSYLMSSPIVNERDVEVKVQDGVVTLEGTIDHLVHRTALQIDIENITGVKEVEVGKLIPEHRTASTAEFSNDLPEARSNIQQENQPEGRPSDLRSEE